MPRRTSLNDAKRVEIAHDLDDMVRHKLEDCRATAERRAADSVRIRNE